MAQSKTITKEYKGETYLLKRNDCDFGDKWTVENDTWTMGPFELKRHAIELAEFAINEGN